jgi:uncharacterized protein involved in outer membrane biogenesis
MRFSQIPHWLHDKAQELGEKIGYVIDFSDLSYSIRDPKIHLANFKLARKAGNLNLVSMGDLEIRFKWEPLWQRKIEIQSINIDHLAVDVTKDPQLNFYKFVEDIEKQYPPRSTSSNPTNPWRFQIERLDVSNALVRLNTCP